MAESALRVTPKTGHGYVLILLNIIEAKVIQSHILVLLVESIVFTSEYGQVIFVK